MSETEPSVRGSELNNRKTMLGATAITSDAADQTAAKTDKMEVGQAILAGTMGFNSTMNRTFLA